MCLDCSSLNIECSIINIMTFLSPKIGTQCSNTDRWKSKRLLSSHGKN